MKQKWILMIVLILTLIFLTCGCSTPSVEETEVLGPTQDASALTTAMEVVQLLADSDMEGLAAYAHPDQGIRFTPYSYIDAANNVVLTGSQISGAMADTTNYLWGNFDGSGEPIQLTFSDYYDQFVYNADFADPNIIGNNTIIGTGNSINNIGEIYPDAVFVEFHFTGFDPQYDGLDWTSLRLVLEDVDGMWYVVGIIHDQWTI